MSQPPSQRGGTTKGLDMRLNKSRTGVLMSGAAFLASFLIAGAGAANASTTTEPAEASYSCWQAIDTGESLCVDKGTDLVAAVAEEKGVELVVPDGTSVGGFTTNSARASAATSPNSTQSTVISIIYDNVDYGGGSYVMSVGSGWGWGFATLSPLGWHDRASSFHSYNGCQTALFENENYLGSQIGYAADKSSFGLMNDKGDSWMVH